MDINIYIQRIEIEFLKEKKNSTSQRISLLEDERNQTEENIVYCLNLKLEDNVVDSEQDKKNLLLFETPWYMSLKEGPNEICILSYEMNLSRIFNLLENNERLIFYVLRKKLISGKIEYLQRCELDLKDPKHYDINNCVYFQNENIRGKIWLYLKKGIVYKSLISKINSNELVKENMKVGSILETTQEIQKDHIEYAQVQGNQLLQNEEEEEEDLISKNKNIQEIFEKCLKKNIPLYWIYVDDNNEEQGPFNSKTILQWIIDDYFDDNTNIRLHDRKTFYKLFEVIEYIERNVLQSDFIHMEYDLSENRRNCYDEKSKEAENIKGELQDELQNMLLKEKDQSLGKATPTMNIQQYGFIDNCVNKENSIKNMSPNDIIIIESKGDSSKINPITNHDTPTQNTFKSVRITQREECIDKSNEDVKMRLYEKLSRMYDIENVVPHKNSNVSNDDENENKNENENNNPTKEIQDSNTLKSVKNSKKKNEVKKLKREIKKIKEEMTKLKEKTSCEKEKSKDFSFQNEYGYFSNKYKSDELNIEGSVEKAEQTDTVQPSQINDDNEKEEATHKEKDNTTNTVFKKDREDKTKPIDTDSVEVNNGNICEPGKESVLVSNLSDHFEIKKCEKKKQCIEVVMSSIYQAQKCLRNIKKKRITSYLNKIINVPNSDPFYSICIGKEEYIKPLEEDTLNTRFYPSKITRNESSLFKDSTMPTAFSVKLEPPNYIEKQQEKKRNKKIEREKDKKEQKIEQIFIVPEKKPTKNKGKLKKKNVAKKEIKLNNKEEHKYIIKGNSKRRKKKNEFIKLCFHVLKDSTKIIYEYNSNYEQFLRYVVFIQYYIKHWLHQRRKSQQSQKTSCKNFTESSSNICYPNFRNLKRENKDKESETYNYLKTVCGNNSKVLSRINTNLEKMNDFLYQRELKVPLKEQFMNTEEREDFVKKETKKVTKNNIVIKSKPTEDRSLYNREFSLRMNEENGMMDSPQPTKETKSSLHNLWQPMFEKTLGKINEKKELSDSKNWDKVVPKRNGNKNGNDKSSYDEIISKYIKKGEVDNSDNISTNISDISKNISSKKSEEWILKTQKEKKNLHIEETKQIFTKGNKCTNVCNAMDNHTFNDSFYRYKLPNHSNRSMDTFEGNNTHYKNGIPLNEYKDFRNIDKTTIKNKKEFLNNLINNLKFESILKEKKKQCTINVQLNNPLKYSSLHQNIHSNKRMPMRETKISNLGACNNSNGNGYSMTIQSKYTHLFNSNFKHDNINITKDPFSLKNNLVLGPNSDHDYLRNKLHQKMNRHHYSEFAKRNLESEYAIHE